jgi:response regulator RpfG family c-di-GMP phosphodiesterase
MYKDKSSHKAQNNESILKELKIQLHRQEVKHKDKSIHQKNLFQFLSKYLDLKHEDKQILEEAIIYQDIGLIVANSEQIEEHVEKGYYILKTLHPIKQISTICYHHHERFDGQGYPKGLKGDDIPHKVRILTLLNCIYHEILKSRDIEVIMKSLSQASGHIFDPDMYELINQTELKAFIQSQIGKIYETN